jgi:hypothetical protein
LFVETLAALGLGEKGFSRRTHVELWSIDFAPSSRRRVPSVPGLVREGEGLRRLTFSFSRFFRYRLTFSVYCDDIYHLTVSSARVALVIELTQVLVGTEIAANADEHMNKKCERRS